jgi:hypothetical protein
MTVGWVILALLVVVVVARAMRSADAARRARTPRPGEDLQRVEQYELAPSDWVTVLTVRQAEAVVAKGLLDTAGIDAFLDYAQDLPRPYGPPPSPVMRVRVPPDDAEQARALLGSLD